MLINSDTVLYAENSPAVLVPYTEAHVTRYHGWMQDEVLLENTASERLTLEEEHENMRSWRRDAKKLTFIILDSSRDADMAGDVNLHILQAETEGFNAGNVLAELEVMVAETASRRKGLATCSLRMIMAFARRHLDVTVFIAKVLEGNVSSIRLFRDVLGFCEYRRVRAFGEIHYKLPVDDKTEATLKKTWEELKVESYRNSPYCAIAGRNTF